MVKDRPKAGISKPESTENDFVEIEGQDLASEEVKSEEVSAPPEVKVTEEVQEEGALPTGKGGQFRAIGGGKVVPV